MSAKIFVLPLDLSHDNLRWVSLLLDCSANRIGVRVSLGCHDPDFDLAEGSSSDDLNSVDTCSNDL
jgi:hypothetical protein